MNKTLKFVLIGLVLLVILAVVANKMGWVGKGKTVDVAVTQTQTSEIVETVSASGKIQPEVEVKLSPEVSGEIVELNVAEGDVVKKGQLLCKIKPDILVSGYERTVASYNAQKSSVESAKQQILQVEANYKNIESRFKRNQTLYNEKVLSAAEFDAAKAEFMVAKTNLEQAKQALVGSKFGLQQSAAVVKEAGDNLARTNIYAPVDGVVSKLSVEKGERVVGTIQMTGTEIMRIADLSTMEVNVDVNENDINRLHLGDTALIEVDAFIDKKFKGLVTEIANSATVMGTTADQVTNFAVKVRILPQSYQKLNNNKNAPFKPGLSATVDIQTQRATGLVIPIQSVTTREEERIDNDKPENSNKSKDKSKGKNKIREYVFVLDGTKVKQVEVKTGIQNNENIIILSGLKAKQKVVSAPYSAISKTLKNGNLVEVVDKEKLFKGEVKNDE